MRTRVFRMSSPRAAVALLLGALAAGPARAESIPTCKQPLASVVVLEPDVDWWSEMGLDSPRVLLEVFVDESGCLTRLSEAADLKDKADFGLTPDALKAFPDRDLGPTRGPATHGVGDSAEGGGPNSDGRNGGPSVTGKQVATSDVSVVELTLADQRGGARPVKTRASTRASTGGTSPISSPAFGSSRLRGYANSPLGRRVASAYLEAYRDLIRSLERAAAKESPKKN